MNLKLILAVSLFSLSSFAFGQESSNWNKWEGLIGKWIGEGSGKPGQGEGMFSFTPDLNNKILVRKGHTEFPATDKKSASVYDDLMIISLDFNGNPSKAIYFDNEGHTINYTISYVDNTIVFMSEKITKLPVFRLTYMLLDPETVNIKFEMSQDGVKFMTYIEGKSKKIK